MHWEAEKSSGTARALPLSYACIVERVMHHVPEANQDLKGQCKRRALGRLRCVHHDVGRSLRDACCLVNDACFVHQGPRRDFSGCAMIRPSSLSDSALRSGAPNSYLCKWKQKRRSLGPWRARRARAGSARRHEPHIRAQMAEPSANIRFKFHAMVTSFHSPRTPASPRNKNWRNPSTDLMMPNTGSGVCLRNA